MVLFTTAFPLDVVGEVTFVRPELERLVVHFDRVVVVPAIKGRVQCVLPESGVEIDHGLARVLHPTGRLERARFVLEALSTPWFGEEILRCPSLLSHPGSLKRFAYCVAASRRVGGWLISRFCEGTWDPKSTVAYSYWLNYMAAGLGRARRLFPFLNVISRAHGADIYEDRYVPACYPLHPQAIAAVDRVFVASEAGRRHLEDRYPTAREKLSVAPLGSPDPGFRSAASADGTFRIVSCSTLEKVKRVDLLVGSLAILGSRMPQRVLEWNHLGDGSQRDRIEHLCRRLLPANLKWTVVGRLPPEGVIAHYRDRPVDLFISTTSSEGGRPVSMIEALSCGIPVLSTAAGGVPELIGGDHGWLVAADSSSEEVAEGIEKIVARESLAIHRAAARTYWEEHLRAEALFESFAKNVRALI